MVVSVVLPQIAGPKVNGPVGRVQGPGVRIPLVGYRGVLAIRPGQALDGRDRGGARQLLRFAFLVAGGGLFPTDGAGQVEYLYRGIGRPAGAVEFEPLAPGGDVSQTVAIAPGKVQGQGII